MTPKNSFPPVSIIIPTFNSSNTIAETIKSVLGQKYTYFEVIVVDDGSIDNTSQIVAQFQDERIRYIYQPNQERAMARNTGINQSCGKYIAFLDADDIWLENKLENQLRLLESSPGLGMVYSDVLYFDGDTGEDLFVYSQIEEMQRGYIWEALLFDSNFIQSPTPVVPRSVFEKVGLFDASLPPVEDWDMWLRIAARYPVDYVDEPLARYRFRKQSTSWLRPDDKLYRSTINLFRKAQSQLTQDDDRIRKKILNRVSRLHYYYSLHLIRQKSFGMALCPLLEGARINPIFPLQYVTDLVSKRVIKLGLIKRPCRM